MSFRTLRYRDVSEESTFDLNLAPMMDMLVSIILFMLLSATFIQILVISTPLPQQVAQALADDRALVKRDVSISVTMTSQTGFALEVKDEAGKITKFLVPVLKTSEFDYASLHKRLVEAKQKFPKVFRVELNPEENIPYDSVVKAMDASRNMEGKDPKVLIEGAETPLLFPDVVLANIMS